MQDSRALTPGQPGWARTRPDLRLDPEREATDAFDRLLLGTRHGWPNVVRHEVARLKALGYVVERLYDPPGFRLIPRRRKAAAVGR